MYKYILIIVVVLILTAIYIVTYEHTNFNSILILKNLYHDKNSEVEGVHEDIIKEYRYRYSANSYNNSNLVTLSLKSLLDTNLTDEQIHNISNIALSNNDSLLIAASITPTGARQSRQYVKILADAGDSYYQAIYGNMLLKYNKSVALSYIDKSAKAKNLLGYSLYLNNMPISSHEFCTTVEDGYNKHGMFVFHENIINRRKTYRLYQVLKECTIFDKSYSLNQMPQQMLEEIGTPDALYEKALLSLSRKQYKDAYTTLRSISNSDNILIASNSRYCLGMMYLYGKGTSKNTNIAIKLLDNSYSLGQYISYSPSKYKNLLPQATYITNINNTICELSGNITTTQQTEETFDPELVSIIKDMEVKAKQGNSVYQSMYGNNLINGIGITQNIPEGLKYLIASAKKKNNIAQKHIIKYMIDYEDPTYCTYAVESYKSNGFRDFIAYIHDDIPQLLWLQNNCKVFNQKTYKIEELPERLLIDINNNESKFMLATDLLVQNRDEDAFVAFNNLFNINDVRLKANTYFCLGIMHYNAVGTSSNRVLAKEYMLQSIKFGQLIYPSANKPNIPYSDNYHKVISNYASSGYCDN